MQFVLFAYRVTASPTQTTSQRASQTATETYTVVQTYLSDKVSQHTKHPAFLPKIAFCQSLETFDALWRPVRTRPNSEASRPSTIQIFYFKLDETARYALPLLEAIETRIVVTSWPRCSLRPFRIYRIQETGMSCTPLIRIGPLATMI